LEDTSTSGSIVTTSKQKRTYATKSAEFNEKDPVFKKIFGGVLEKERAARNLKPPSSEKKTDNASEKKEDETPQETNGNQNAAIRPEILYLLVLLFAIILYFFT
jgi:hypothetical protein